MNRAGDRVLRLPADQAEAAANYLAWLAYPNANDEVKRFICIRALLAWRLREKCVDDRFRWERQSIVSGLLLGDQKKDVAAANLALDRIKQRRLPAAGMTEALLLASVPGVSVRVGTPRGPRKLSRRALAEHWEGVTGRTKAMDRIWIETGPVLHLALAFRVICAEDYGLRKGTIRTLELVEGGWTARAAEKAEAWRAVIEELAPKSALPLLRVRSAANA